MTSTAPRTYVLVSGRPGSVTVRRFPGPVSALRAKAALPAGTPVRYVGPLQGSPS